MWRDEAKKSWSEAILGPVLAIELVYAWRMEPGLTESIETLEIPPHAAAVVEVAQQYSALGAKLTLALAELDHRGDYELEGYASMTAWCRTSWAGPTAWPTGSSRPAGAS